MTVLAHRRAQTFDEFFFIRTDDENRFHTIYRGPFTLL